VVSHMWLRNLLLLLASSAAVAAPKNEPVARIREAARVFTEIQNAKDNAIPDALLDKANGIIIVPGLKRAGFVVGGQYGKGGFGCSTAKRPMVGTLYGPD